MAGEPTELEPDRIQIPPEGRGLLSTDWRGKYVFDFQLPPAEQVYEIRVQRARRGTHPVDKGISLQQVQQQFAVYRELAWYFHCKGMNVIVRESFEGNPRCFPDTA